MLLLSISLNSQTVNIGEYFFDVDPGYGNGIAMPTFTASNSVDISFTANTIGLAAGYHHLYVRFKDSNGEWGLYSGRTIHVLPTSQPAPVSPDIIIAEYFFDTDPGYGNGIAVPSFTANDSVDVNFTINTIGLTEGYHKLFIRFKDDNGEWGLYSGRTINILAPTSTFTPPTNITSAEYFFDTDPGNGNGIILPSFSPSDTVDNLFNAPVSALSVGLHHVFIRYRDSLGEWGLYSGRQFDVLNCTNPIPNFTVQAACTGDSITLINTSANADSLYLWDFNNDNIWDDSTAGNTTFLPSFIDSGTVKLKLINMVGCADSISININLNPIFDSLISYTTCDSALIHGNWYFSTQLVTDSLVTISGCDSIVKTNLIIKYSTTSTINIAVCDTYTSPTGNILTSTGIYTDTLLNSNGCDSIVITNLTIHHSSSSNSNITVCGSYISPTGNILNSSGIYIDTISNVNGCDSIITTSLTVHNASSSNSNITVCGSYISPSGNILNSSGIYVDTISNSNGCDSIITTNLTVNYGDAGIVSISGITLSVDITGASYQWLDCNNMYSEITGANNQLYIPIINGNYACEVMGVNGCIDTTDCAEINNVGLENGNTDDNYLIIYPNPASGILFLEMNELKELEVKIFDGLGKIVYSKSVSDISKMEIDISTLAPGQYYISLSNGVIHNSQKIVVY